MDANPNAPSVRIALTADLHYGTRHASGNEATERLVADLIDNPPDALILAGDIGAGDDFRRCLALFDRLDCVKALVPGNHDIWVRPYDGRGDSWQVYDELLPSIARESGFHYLDNGPLMLPNGPAVVGNMNWYDYSWAVDRLPEFFPDWEDRLLNKRFTRGQHNDRNFVRWSQTDASFSRLMADRLDAHLRAAFVERERAIVVMHHPPLRSMLPTLDTELPPDSWLWRAFSGNAAVESRIEADADAIPLIFCGHTHRQTDRMHLGMRTINIGGDYHFKRLMRVTWPTLEIEATDFGERGE